MRSNGDTDADLTWYFQQAEGDACGLRAQRWDFTDEAVDGSSAPPARGGRPVDPYPDTHARDRSRLRRVHAAYVACSTDTKAVLEAYYGRLSYRVPVPGLGAIAWVAMLLADAEPAAPGGSRASVLALGTKSSSDRARVLRRAERLLSDAREEYARHRLAQLEEERREYRNRYLRIILGGSE
jgi:hypothetical protein